MKSGLKSMRMINQLVVSKEDSLRNLKGILCVPCIARRVSENRKCHGYSIIWEMSSVSQHESVLRWGTSDSLEPMNSGLLQASSWAN